MYKGGFDLLILPHFFEYPHENEKKLYQGRFKQTPRTPAVLLLLFQCFFFILKFTFANIKIKKIC